LKAIKILLRLKKIVNRRINKKMMDEKTRKNQMKVIAIAAENLGSQAELARRLSIIPQNFNRYATGKRELHYSMYLRILKIGGMK